jgi:hypothetical protein
MFELFRIFVDGGEGEPTTMKPELLLEDYLKWWNKVRSVN